MVEFLRLSPSYAFAREVALNGLNQARIEKQLFAMHVSAETPLSSSAKAALLKDFELVQKTYAEFGDVLTIDFDNWWLERGADLFGFDYERPRIIKIAQLVKDEKHSSAPTALLNDYLKSDRIKQGMPPSLILAVPLGVPKRTLMMELSKLIDKANVPAPPKAQKAKRTLTKQRLRSKPLFMFTKLLMFKAGSPSSPLWKLGLRANVSPKHSEDMSLDSKVSTKNIDQRMNLTVLTSRALRKAKLIAENAARGQFPSTDARALPDFDWDATYERLRIAYPRLKARKKTKAL
ncbi:hypothetical protein MCEKH45_00091 [Methylophilaceae bacterium]